MTQKKSLEQIVTEKPFPEFIDWWPMGELFLQFMSEAICSEWRKLPHNEGHLTPVQNYGASYLNIVFEREAVPGLVEAFAARPLTQPILSGEFDALSYAFYRSAFELIEQHQSSYKQSLVEERRLFTKRVGQIFFRLLQKHLALDIPAALEDSQNFSRLKACIKHIGEFLVAEGYLRDHFKFTFDLDIDYGGRIIRQAEADVIGSLDRSGLAYALYEMGYPVILPSAVYLYHTIGEAQHHSSRTIEELFARTGTQARETDDFDPIGYPPDRVVELWEIRRL